MCVYRFIHNIMSYRIIAYHTVSYDVVVDDDKEADGDISIITIDSNVSNSIVNTSLNISNIKMSSISSIKSTARMIVNRWQWRNSLKRHGVQLESS